MATLKDKDAEVYMAKSATGPYTDSQKGGAHNAATIGKNGMAYTIGPCT